MNFAGMGQFRALAAAFRPTPAGAVLLHQQFLRHGQTDPRRNHGLGRLPDRRRCRPGQLHAETVDGSNPLAVADAVARKTDLLRAGEGPALLDIECYRYSGHSTTDTNAYRSRDEMKAGDADPITGSRPADRWRRDHWRRG